MDISQRRIPRVCYSPVFVVKDGFMLGKILSRLPMPRNSFETDSNSRGWFLPVEDHAAIFHLRGRDGAGFPGPRAPLESAGRMRRLISCSLMASRCEASSRRNCSTVARRWSTARLAASSRSWDAVWTASPISAPVGKRIATRNRTICRLWRVTCIAPNYRYCIAFARSSCHGIVRRRRILATWRR